METIVSNSNKPHTPPRNTRPNALLASVILLTLAAGATTLATGAVGLSTSPAGTLTTAAVGLNTAAVALNTAAVGLPDKDKPSTPKPIPPSSLRCWQFGKLIFEEIGVVPHQKVLEASHEWTRVQSRGALYLFHSGETTCLFSQSALP